MRLIVRIVVFLSLQNYRYIEKYTHLTELFENLRPLGTKRFFIVCAIHFVALAIGFVELYRRGNLIFLGVDWLVALFFASLWAVLAPLMIWAYERIFVAQFIRDYRRTMWCPEKYLELLSIANKSIYQLPFSNILISIWMSVVLITFLSGHSVLSMLGVTGIFDWLWLYIAGGVAFYAYYSAIGICFVYKTILMCGRVEPISNFFSIYQPDKAMGLSFVGSFSQKTTLFFITGWLFFPLLYLAATTSSDLQIKLISIIAASYTLIILLIFLSPIFIVRRKIRKAKSFLERRSYCEIKKIMNEFQNERNDHDFTNMFLIYHKLQEDAHNVSDWPLNIDIAVRFLISNLSFPLIVGIILNFLN